MEERRDQPERIEIELTSHAPGPGGRETREPPAAPTSSHDDDAGIAVSTSRATEPARRASDRGRSVVAGTMIGLIGLLLGFVVGRAGSPDGSAADEPPTTEATSTTVDGSLNPIEPPADLGRRATTTTKPPRTTTTAGSPTREVGRLAVAPLLANTDFQVVAIREQDELVVVDTADGSTTTSQPRALRFLVPQMIHAGDGWVLIPDFGGGAGATLLLDDGTDERIDSGTVWQMLMEPGHDVFWRIGELGSFPGVAEELTYDGTPTGRVLDLPDWPVAVDPLGGLAVASSGGVYAIGDGRPERLTTGQLLALGATRLLAHECDESLDCAHVVIERTTGERRILPISGLEEGQRLGIDGWFGAPTLMGPNGDAVLLWAAATRSTAPPVGGHLDLVTGVFTALPSSTEPTRMVWSPDGRFVLWLRQSTLMVFDPAAGVSVPFAEGFDAVRAFTVRPAP